MSKERMVQVTKDEYKDLIRDQHTVELLTGYVQEQSWIIDSTICKSCFSGSLPPCLSFSN